LIEMARGAVVINTLRTHDKVLMAEACSHHAVEDDIHCGSCMLTRKEMLSRIQKAKEEKVRSRIMECAYPSPRG
jgi:hypothetical protein